MEEKYEEGNRRGWATMKEILVVYFLNIDINK